MISDIPRPRSGQIPTSDATGVTDSWNEVRYNFNVVRPDAACKKINRNKWRRTPGGQDPYTKETARLQTGKTRWVCHVTWALHLAIKDLCGKDNVVVIAGEGKLDCDFLSS